MYKKIRITGEVFTNLLKSGDVVDALICPLSGQAWTIVHYQSPDAYSSFWINAGKFEVVEEKKPEITAVNIEGAITTKDIRLPADLLKILTVEFK